MSDPYWRDVVLLLRAEGGAIVDKKGHPYTVTGNTSVSSAQYAPLTGATESIYFDGTGDRLTFNASSDWSLGNTFTVEFWAYHVVLPSGADERLIMIGANGSNTAEQVAFRPAGDTFSGLPLGGAVGNGSVAGAATSGVFDHFAYVLNSGTGQVFKNGLLIGGPNYGCSIQTASLTNQLFIGYDTVGTVNFNFNGYLDEVRITKNVARYSGTFTPPTTRFDTTGVALSGTSRDATGQLASRLVRAYRQDSGSLVAQNFSKPDGTYAMPVSGDIPHTVIEHDITVGDPHWDNVVYLLPMDTVELHDVKGKTVTKSGNVTRSAVQSKFGGYSAYFDGSGDRLQLTCDLSGNHDFTIECFVMLRNGGHGQAYSRIFHLGTGNTQGALNLICAASASTSNVYSSAWDAAEFLVGGTSSPLANDTWYHFAIERVQNQWSCYLDGALLGTAYRGFDLIQTQLNIGANTSLGESFWGYIDEFRVTKGVARHGAPFSPPTAAFPQVGVSPGTANAAVFDNVIPV